MRPIARLATLMLAALLLAAPAAAQEDGGKVLNAFFGLFFKDGNDFRLELRVVGRLLDSVLNARATLEYKDPGLVRVDLDRVEGRITAVLDLNRGEGFYYVPEAGQAVRFKSKEAPWSLKPGDARKALFDHFTAEPLKTGVEGSLPAITGARGDGTRIFSLVFTPGFKSIAKYVRYRPAGDVGFFVTFKSASSGPADPARFELPKGSKVADLPDEATNPFEYLKFE